jgi:hypothetical protein
MSAVRCMSFAMRRGVGASRMGTRAIVVRGGGEEKAPPPFRRLKMPTETVGVNFIIILSAICLMVLSVLL